MSQTIKTLISLRELILNGEIAPGERLLEVNLVDRLGVSRTPIRAALARLAEEGLLEKAPGSGYVVREFTVHDIRDSIEVRGALEGMAARWAAERGVSASALNPIKACVAEIDTLLSQTELSNDGIATYLELNEIFHRQLLSLTNSFVIERMLERIVALPFASPNAFVIATSEIGQSWKIFFVAQDQHRGIVNAIENREGLRAEYLAREHALLTMRVLKTALKHPSVLDQVPGAKLIASAGA